MTSTSQILGAILSGDRGDATLPELLCRACALDVPVTGVGMALMNASDHQGVVAATDGPARLMEELQFTLGEGPCLDASREGRPVLQPDLADTAQRRWPGFGPAVLDAGIAAIFAFPLHVGGIRVGVLDLYRDRPGHLDQRQLATALSHADAALVLLLHLQSQMVEGEGLHPELVDPLDDRAEIHQATGIIAVQAAVGLADALLLLRGRAYAAERSVFDIARDVVARRLRFDDHGGHHG